MSALNRQDNGIMTMRNFIGKIVAQEDLNFLLTNRIPRRWATQFMGWFSQIEIPAVRDLSIGWGDTILMQDIFEFYQTGRGPDGKITGQFRATGNIPKAMSRIRDAGVELPMSLFAPQGSPLAAQLAV